MTDKSDILTMDNSTFQSISEIHHLINKTELQAETFLSHFADYPDKEGHIKNFREIVEQNTQKAKSGLRKMMELALQSNLLP